MSTIWLYIYRTNYKKKQIEECNTVILTTLKLHSIKKAIQNLFLIYIP